MSPALGLMIVFYGFTALVSIVLGLIALIEYNVRREHYGSALKLLKRTKNLLVDSNGYIPPEYAAFIAFRGGDVNLATKYLEQGMRGGTVPVHYLLKIGIAAASEDWPQADEAVIQLKLSAKDLGYDRDKLGDINHAVAARNKSAVFGSFSIGRFGNVYLSEGE